MAFFYIMSVEAPNTSLKDPIAGWNSALADHRQRHYRRIYQTGEFTPYDREKKPIKWDAFRDACYEWVTNPGAFIKNAGKHVRKIDYEFRGERDIGDAGERLQRTWELSKIIAVFTVFDWATSTWRDDDYILGKYPRETEDRDRDSRVGAFIKLIDVMNDKYATALANKYVEDVTGERGRFIHEVSDKGADTLNVGIADKYEDLVNGPVLESGSRILFQIPIAGALLEQGLTRLSMLQERSPLSTATGKMVYMALGAYLYVLRDVKGRKRKALNMKYG